MNNVDLTVLRETTIAQIKNNLEVPDNFVVNSIKLSDVFLAVVKKQDEVNTKMGGPGWTISDNEYISALHVETGELIEAIGYEWWKTRVEDRNNVLVELCDIFTFGISHIIINETDVAGSVFPNAFSRLSGELAVIEYDAVTARSIARALTTDLEVYDGMMFASSFIQLVYTLGFTLEDLILVYFCKAELNKFRTDNGYKEGNYRKIWDDGREDNYHMMDYLLSEEASSLASPNERLDHVFSSLSSQYKKENS